MKVSTSIASTLAGLAATATALSLPRADDSLVEKRAAGTLGLPSDTLVTSGVSFGFLPSDGSATSPAYTMADLNGKLGANASTYGWYAQVSSSSWSGSQLLEVKDDVVASGAVFQPAVMPTGGFSQITSDVALQIATVLQEFTDAGVEVWLRFGHEMNYYVTTGTYSGTADEFVSAWKVVHDAVSSNSKIAMFWSPNNVGENQDASGLDPWFPGPDYVDVVGIDCYPSSSSSTFDGCYSSFYKEFSAAYNKPFAIGETGAGDFKESWLKQLVSQDASTYPNYVAASWFEYDKEADFRIVETDDTTLSETKATLLSGSGTGSGGSSSTTTSSAPASTSTSACTWGCWGWDCSASVPCQSQYTCTGGYCK